MLGRIKRLPDRWLHARRRRVAMENLQAWARHMGPGPVVFICYGNICRSPFAEVMFRTRMTALTREPYSRVVQSAGFIGPNRGSPPEALAAAAQFDIDLSSHRSALISPDLFRSASLIVTMSLDQVRDLRNRFGRSNGMLLVLGDLDPGRVTERTIKDPWGHPPEVFVESYARIERCIGELTAVLAGA